MGSFIQKQPLHTQGSAIPLQILQFLILCFFKMTPFLLNFKLIKPIAQYCCKISMNYHKMPAPRRDSRHDHNVPGNIELSLLYLTLQHLLLLCLRPKQKNKRIPIFFFFLNSGNLFLSKHIDLEFLLCQFSFR